MKDPLIASAASTRLQASCLIPNLNRQAAGVLTLGLGLILCLPQSTLMLRAIRS